MSFIAWIQVTNFFKACKITRNKSARIYLLLYYVNRIVTTTKQARESACCPNVEEQICICDVNSCPADLTVCKTYERKYQTNPGECCPKYSCECDHSKFDLIISDCYIILLVLHAWHNLRA